VLSPEIALEMVYSEQLAQIMVPFDPRYERMGAGSWSRRFTAALLRIDKRGDYGEPGERGRGGRSGTTGS